MRIQWSGKFNYAPNHGKGMYHRVDTSKWKLQSDARRGTISLSGTSAGTPVLTFYSAMLALPEKTKG